MDSNNQAVSKILEALSPGLTAEVERLLGDSRQQQEEDFRKRLEAALREAENVALSAAQVEKERAVAEERQKVSAELKAQFDQTLQKTTTELQSKLADQTRTATNQRDADKALWDSEKAGWASEKASLQQQVSLWRTYAEAQGQLAESSSQTEILTKFLNLIEPFADAVGLYVTKSDGLALWKSRGKATFSALVSKDTSDPESYFKAIVVRGRTVAAVCAPKPFRAEPLDFLSTCLGRAIEAFGMKLQSPAPATPASPGASAAPAAKSSADGSPPEDKLVADARRAARLLVSEIKLYNEQAVRDGRANSDLYGRLQKQIEQGREQYRQRVNGGVLASRDYFHEELVRVLADGETSRLGSNYPGPMTS